MELLRPQDLAKILHLRPPSIRRLIERGEFPSVKRGGRLYIVKMDLDNLINRRKVR